MLKGKDDDHKHSTCDPKGANIDAQKHHFRFQKKWSAVGGTLPLHPRIPAHSRGRGRRALYDVRILSR